MLVTWNMSANIAKITQSFLMEHAMEINRTRTSAQTDIDSAIKPRPRVERVGRVAKLCRRRGSE